MSRTTRFIPHHNRRQNFKSYSDNEHTINRQLHGADGAFVNPIPIGVNGLRLVWGPKAKKLAKRQIRRLDRHQNRISESSTMQEHQELTIIEQEMILDEQVRIDEERDAERAVDEYYDSLVEQYYDEPGYPYEYER